MLEKYLPLLKEELFLEVPFVIEKGGGCHILFDPDIEVFVCEKDGSFLCKGKIAEVPASNSDVWLIQVMEANLFGMGTRGAVIGLDSEEKFLTLSYQLPITCTYDEFKEGLQDFVSVVAHWKEQLLQSALS